MKKSIPVTSREIAVPFGVSLVSKTDLKGRITYANDAFVKISGYSKEELLGKPHNIVRHPDMPAVVFKSLWEHIKQGHPWKGIVKNRAKDGDVYWVSAQIVPIRKEDQIIGYMSVRKRASAEEVKEAVALYATLEVKGRKFKLPDLRVYLTIRSAYIAGSLFVTFLILAGAGLGIGGLRKSNAELTQIRTGTIKATKDIAEVKQQILEIRSLMGEIAPATKDTLLLATTIRTARNLADSAASRIDANQWLKGAGSKSSSQVLDAYGRLMSSLVIPTEYMLEHEQLEQAVINAELRGRPEYESAMAALRELDAEQAELAKISMSNTENDNLIREKIAIIGLLIGLLVVGVAGFIVQRRIVTPLDQAIKSLDRMAQGDLGGDINIYQMGETGHLLRANAVMQLHLNVIMDEIRMVAKNMYDYVNGLNHSLYELNGVTEEQHEGLYRAKDALVQVAQDTDASRTRVDNVLAHLAGIAGQESTNDRLGMAMLTDFTSSVSSALRFQNLSASEAADRMQRIADLVVDSRQGTQAAYAASQSLQKQADELLALVSYFETGKDTEDPEAEGSPSL